MVRMSEGEGSRHRINFPNRTSPDNTAFICNVWEAMLDDILIEKDTKKDWTISTVDVNGEKIKVLKIKESTPLFTSSQMLYRDKARTVMDENGHIYYFDKETGQYTFDSTITDISKIKKIFETLKAKDE